MSGNKWLDSARQIDRQIAQLERKVSDTIYRQTIRWSRATDSYPSRASFYGHSGEVWRLIVAQAKEDIRGQ